LSLLHLFYPGNFDVFPVCLLSFLLFPSHFPRGLYILENIS
jgi:hypothetical protein